MSQRKSLIPTTSFFSEAHCWLSVRKRFFINSMMVFVLLSAAYIKQSSYVYSNANVTTGVKIVTDSGRLLPGFKKKQNFEISSTLNLPGVRKQQFQNPLIGRNRPDPYVAQKDGYYYFMYTRGNKLSIVKTRSMSLLADAKDTIIWTPPAGTDHSSDLWAPELHFLSGKWYIYFAASNGKDETHRMFVLENKNADPTTGMWTFKGKISDPSDQWAIDGSVLTIGEANYFVWSGWESESTRHKQHLYLARMSDPWTISGDRIKISSPTYDWEKHEPGSLSVGVNEGPIMLQKDKNSPVFIIYSASRFTSDDYCLAQIQLKPDGEPTDARDWINKKQVFVKDSANSVYGPGHNGFFTSSYTDKKGGLKSETWFVYHARSTAKTRTGARTPRMQRLTWRNDGSPDFGIASATGVDMPVPIAE